MQKSSVYVYVGLVVVGLLLAWLFHQVQPANRYAENPLADANEYLKIYQYFKGETAAYEVRYGIHQRVAVPFLATLLPFESAERCFFIVNSFFAILALPLLYGFLTHFQIRNPYALPIILYFSVHWVGPFRQNAIDPVNVDMPVYVFEIFLVLLLLNKKYWMLLPLVPLAIAVKEVFLGYLIVLLVSAIAARIFMADKSISVSWAVVLLTVGFLTSLVVNNFFPSPFPSRTPIHVLAFHIRETALHPDYLLRWGLSLFAALGAFLWLVIRKYEKSPWSRDGGLILPAFSFAALAFSLFGGMDYTRLIFIEFPYLMVLLLIVTKPTNGEFYLAFGLSLVLTRFWMVLPVIGADLTPYNAWMPEYAELQWLAIWAITALLSLAVVLIMRILSGKKLHSPKVGNDV